MTRLVLESFYYAHDGRNAKLLCAGKTVRVFEDILPEHVERFVAEGKIEGGITVDVTVYTNDLHLLDRPKKPKGRRK